MKIAAILLTLIVGITMKHGDQKSIHDFKMKQIDGTEKNLADFKGKPILIINTASKCGYTKQYAGLQKLQEKYGKELIIIGFPANNFMKQEPGTNKEIASFCSANYGVTFTMSEKVSVKGKDQAPLFHWLTEQENPDFTGEIKWNFEKFLLDKNGKLIRRFRSGVTPESDEMIKAIESAL